MSAVLLAHLQAGRAGAGLLAPRCTPVPWSTEYDVVASCACAAASRHCHRRKARAGRNVQKLQVAEDEWGGRRLLSGPKMDRPKECSPGLYSHQRVSARARGLVQQVSGGVQQFVRADFLLPIMNPFSDHTSAFLHSAAL